VECKNGGGDNTEFVSYVGKRGKVAVGWAVLTGTRGGPEQGVGRMGVKIGKECGGNCQRPRNWENHRGRL